MRYDYSAAPTVLQTARDKRSKPIANNTRLEIRDGGTPERNAARFAGKPPSYAIRLHGTDILTFRPDGSVVYNTGGWRTVTTKERMNRFGPARIWSDRGTWYISVGDQTRVYKDGCSVRKGRILGAGSDREKARDLRTRARIREYAKQFVDRMDAGKIPKPDAGDCWLCLLFPECEPGTDRSHYEGHLKDKYYVPSFLARIVKDPKAGLSIAARDWVASIWNPTQEGAEAVRKLFGSIAKDQIRKAIVKRLYREMGV